jgi:hypothetical protein
MSEPKTKPTSQRVEEFLNTVEPTQKRIDSFTLLEMFEKATGQKARMWGAAIVGFGSYRSNTGEWPLVAFSPRKQNLTLYVATGSKYDPKILAKLGKYKVSGVCLHINKLSDVDLDVLDTIIKNLFDHSNVSTEC